MNIPDPWRCWRCGGTHSYFVARCPNSGVNDGAPTNSQMKARLSAWLAANHVEER